MERSDEMDNVIVTGGSRGIGLAICRRLAASGYHALSLARSQSAEFQQACEEATRVGRGKLTGVTFDLANKEGIAKLVRQIRSDSGPIYGLVNNAGISSEGLTATMHNSQIEKMIAINILAPILMSKYVCRSMINEGRGRIINISSIVASSGYNGLSVYGATKASLNGFTKSLARELGKLGINVNSVAPGFIDTEMTRGLNDAQRQRVVRRSALRRLASAEDVANTVAFLLGESGSNITGSVITVDAGNTA